MIKDKPISSNTSPMFILKYLGMMYQEKIKHFGAPDSAVRNVNVTRLLPIT